MGRTAGAHTRLLATLLVTLGAGGVAAPQNPPRPATPFEPIAAILTAFERHEIVALGDPHGNEQAHEFRLELIRDPRFAATVDDIVVEWGNARYQDVMDRFVDGDDVSDAELRQVWQNTTQPGQGNDRPVTETFFRAVREVNAPPHARPADRARGGCARVHRLADRGRGSAGARAGRGVVVGSQLGAGARHRARRGGLHRVLPDGGAPRDDPGRPDRADPP